MRLATLFTFLLVFTYSCSRNTNDSYCMLYEPVYYNGQDIKEKSILNTIRQNNALYYEMCMAKVKEK